MSREPQSEQDEQKAISAEQEALSPLDDTWAELSQDWQSQAVPKTDIAALVKQTKRRTQGAKLCFALNIIVTLALLVFFLYGVWQGQLGEPVNTYLGGGAFLSIIFVYLETKVRLATWRQLCDSPEKAIDNAIISCQSSIKYMVITKLSFIPFLLLVNWFVYTVSKVENKDMLTGFIYANGLMLFMYAFVDYLHRKRKKQYKQLVDSVSELKSG